ncbi:hypothetical protein L1987_63694 [Smallanthus sonchifolius]|uniref:Uncharacterized protein n=1 Tax=Smallanthus sonchifolius TaxID=185202 RepID=A0ACB9CDY7_9ASTR|nr:hypothetical protein L1987_63694 [Smallanthus sonchifolius]
MILAVRFEEDKQLFAIKRSGGVQYLKSTREAFNSLPKYDLVNLGNRELLGHSNHAVVMGLWVVLQREARSGKFEVFKPQVPKRFKDKTARHPVTKKFLKKLVYKSVLCETKIPLSKLSQDILGDMWYWYVDPKTGETVVIGKVRSESGCLVPRELIRVFDEVCFITFSVKDLEALADRLKTEDSRLKIEDDPELLSRGSLLKHFPVTNTLDRLWIDRTLHLVTGIPHPVRLVDPLACDDPPHPRDLHESIYIEGEKKGKVKMCSYVKATKYMVRGCKAYMACVTNVVERVKDIRDVPVVNHFVDVFPDELPGVPSEREVEFGIDLIPGAKPVAKAPYRLAPPEMKELMEQLQELLDKGFVRPSVSRCTRSLR